MLGSPLQFAIITTNHTYECVNFIPLANRKVLQILSDQQSKQQALEPCTLLQI